MKNKQGKVFYFDSFNAKYKLVRSFNHKISAYLYMGGTGRNAEGPKNVKVVKGESHE